MLVLYAAIIAICIALNTLLLVYLWIIPLVLGQPFLRLYLMAEHGRCPHVANMLENTRTTYTTRAMRWLAWSVEIPLTWSPRVSPKQPQNQCWRTELTPFLARCSGSYG